MTWRTLFGRDNAAKRKPPPPEDVLQIEAFIREKLATRLKLPIASIGMGTALSELPMDSLALVNFLTEVEDWMQVEVELSLLLDNETIGDVVRGLEALRLGASPAAAAAPASST